MKEKKIMLLPGKCSPVIEKFQKSKSDPPAFLKVKSEMQFCYHCGGWCSINYDPCPVCLGRGSVRVTLPLAEEWALAE